MIPAITNEACPTSLALCAGFQRARRCRLWLQIVLKDGISYTVLRRWNRLRLGKCQLLSGQDHIVFTFIRMTVMSHVICTLTVRV